jgi:hypothetical protein
MLIWGVPIFFAQKNHFPFLVPKMWSFVKHIPKICWKNGPPQFTKSIPFYGQFTCFCMEKVL